MGDVHGASSSDDQALPPSAPEPLQVSALSGNDPSREITLRVRPISTDEWMKLSHREQQLSAIGDVIAYWMKFVTRQHEAENLTVTVDTHIVLPGENGPPCWPSMGQLGRWLEVLQPGQQGGGDAPA